MGICFFVGKMTDRVSHHMIYGTIKDYITGETIVDTDDERFRQKVARFLVEKKGYPKKNIQARKKIETLFGKSFVVSTIDLVISLQKKIFMVVRYGPGSLVTRERAAVAAARVLDPAYLVPYTVITNGLDAEFLDSKTGKVLAHGMDGIPNFTESKMLYDKTRYTKLHGDYQREMELRVLNAYDKEVCCAGGPCVLPSAPEG